MENNRIFINEEWEQYSIEGGIPHYGYYHKYRLPDGSTNPEFRTDKISGLILDLKYKKERALSFFFSELKDEFIRPVTICVVPSHEKSIHNDSGIAILARRLASDGRIDKVDFLLRNEEVDMLAKAGTRDVKTYQNTIIANPMMKIQGDVVLLMDDATTTGNSLVVCKSILEENGASRVAMFALGQSI